MSNDRFNSLAPNKLSEDNNKDKVSKKDTNFKKEVDVEDKKINMFKKKTQNKRFNFNSETNDNRSYKLDSSKLISTGFSPKYCIEDAIDENINNFQKGILKEDESFYTVNWMKKLNVENLN